MSSCHIELAAAGIDECECLDPGFSSGGAAGRQGGHFQQGKHFHKRATI